MGQYFFIKNVELHRSKIYSSSVAVDNDERVRLRSFRPYIWYLWKSGRFELATRSNRAAGRINCTLCLFAESLRVSPNRTRCNPANTFTPCLHSPREHVCMIKRHCQPRRWRSPPPFTSKTSSIRSNLTILTLKRKLKEKNK